MSSHTSLTTSSWPSQFCNSVTCCRLEGSAVRFLITLWISMMAFPELGCLAAAILLAIDFSDVRAVALLDFHVSIAAALSAVSFSSSACRVCTACNAARASPDLALSAASCRSGAALATAAEWASLAERTCG